jgi:hypothetical protein
VDAAAAATSDVVVSSSTSISDAMGRVGSGGRGRVREGGERAGGRGGGVFAWAGVDCVCPTHPAQAATRQERGRWPEAGGGGEREGRRGLGPMGLGMSDFACQRLGSSRFKVWACQTGGIWM